MKLFPFFFCGVNGIRTTWHSLFHGLALPWEYHMSTPPELSHLFCTGGGTRTPTLKAGAPKAPMSTIPPHRHLQLVVVDFIRNPA